MLAFDQCQATARRFYPPRRIIPMTHNPAVGDIVYAKWHVGTANSGGSGLVNPANSSTSALDAYVIDEIGVVDTFYLRRTPNSPRIVASRKNFLTEAELPTRSHPDAKPVPAPAIAELEPYSGAWWDLVNAVNEAQSNGLKLSVSIDRNGHGETLTAVKVSEGLWSAHRKGALA